MEYDIERNYVNVALNDLLKEKRAIDPQNKEAVLVCNNKIIRKVINGDLLLAIKDEQASTQLQIVKSAQGNRFLCVFTDWQNIGQYGNGHEGVLIGFEEIMDAVLNEQCGLVINPYTDHLTLSYATMEKLKTLRKPTEEKPQEPVISEEPQPQKPVEDTMPAEEMKPVRENTPAEETTPVEQPKPEEKKIVLTLPDDQPAQLEKTGSIVLTLTPAIDTLLPEEKPEPAIQLANLKSTPTVLVDALSDYGKKVKELQKVWLKMMRKGDEVRMLLIVQSSGKEREIHENIRMIAAPYLPYGMLLDIEDIQSPLGARAADNTPIYIRKRGLFG